MKNTFLVLAFMLMGTFAFASTVIESNIKNNLENAIGHSHQENSKIFVLNSSSEFSISKQSKNFNFLGDCKIKIEIKDADGNLVFTVEITISDISCEQLINAIAS